jgi:hypothetical protein
MAAFLRMLLVVSCCGAAAVAQAESAGAPEPQDVLEAERTGLAAVKYVPNDSRSAQIVVTNRSGRPLTLRLPAAFAGVPVLAQINVGAQGNQAGFGAGGIGAAPQATGGGAAGGGMGMGGGGAGVGFCWVAREVYGVHDPRWLEFRGWLHADAPDWLREAYRAHGESFAAWIHDRPLAKRAVRGVMDGMLADRAARAAGGQFRVTRSGGDGSFAVQAGGTRTFRFATVCLEHGKPEPSPRVPYRLERLETFSPDPRLAVVMACLASGQVSQKAAQAAAWHLASGLTWERLAAEMIDHAGGDPDEPFFAAADLAVARQLVELATRSAAQPRVTAPTE